MTLTLALSLKGRGEKLLERLFFYSFYLFRGRRKG